MSVKCTGAELNAFLDDPAFWKVGGDDHTWYDDAVMTMDGADWDGDPKAEPTSKCVIEGGVVCGFVIGPAEPSVEAYFRRWKKAQTSVLFTGNCPKEAFEAVKAAVKAAGGKVES